MATAKEIIAKARSYVGTKETPANSNNVIFNTRYYNKPVSGSQYPWCAVFVWAVFQDCNASELFYDGKKTALCMTLGDWFKQQGRFYTSSPQVGDLIFFKFGTNSRWTNHVGIVSEVNSNGTIKTIEGNTSSTSEDNGGAVMERTRKITSSIVGYGRPTYTTGSAVIPTVLLDSVNQEKKYPMRGIDISGYQSNLNYSQLKSAGVQFAILKIIRKDLGKDKGYDIHLAGCKSAGIKVVGVYNYSYATTVEKAKIDAQKVVSYLQGQKLTVWLDVEDNVQKNLGERLAQIINAYQTVIENAGLTFGIYTGLSFYNSYIKPYIGKINTRNFWIARYYNGYTEMRLTDELNANYRPSITGNLIGWQYTSSGVVGGSAGRLDLNIFYSPVLQSTNIPNIIPSTNTNNNIIKVKITAKSGLRVRSTPDTSTNKNILGKYNYGEIVAVTEGNKNWWKTDKGYISKTYTKTL